MTTLREDLREARLGRVLAAYRELANGGGYVNAGVRKIANLTGLSTQQVVTLTAQLVERGWLERAERQHLLYRSQKYRVLNWEVEISVLDPEWSSDGLGEVAWTLWRYLMDSPQALSTSEIAKAVGASVPTARKHLRKLDGLGLAEEVSKARWEGRTNSDVLAAVRSHVNQVRYEMSQRYSLERAAWRKRLAIQATRLQDRKEGLNTACSSRVRQDQLLSPSGELGVHQ